MVISSVMTQALYQAAFVHFCAEHQLKGWQLGSDFFKKKVDIIVSMVIFLHDWLEIVLMLCFL